MQIIPPMFVRYNPAYHPGGILITRHHTDNAPTPEMPITVADIRAKPHGRVLIKTPLHCLCTLRHLPCTPTSDKWPLQLCLSNLKDQKPKQIIPMKTPLNLREITHEYSFKLDWSGLAQLITRAEISPHTQHTAPGPWATSAADSSCCTASQPELQAKARSLSGSTAL